MKSKETNSRKEIENVTARIKPRKRRQPANAVIIESRRGKLIVRVAGRILFADKFDSLDAALKEAGRILTSKNGKQS